MGAQTKSHDPHSHKTTLCLPPHQLSLLKVLWVMLWAAVLVLQSLCLYFAFQVQRAASMDCSVFVPLWLVLVCVIVLVNCLLLAEWALWVLLCSQLLAFVTLLVLVLAERMSVEPIALTALMMPMA